MRKDEPNYTIPTPCDFRYLHVHPADGVTTSMMRVHVGDYSFEVSRGDALYLAACILETAETLRMRASVIEQERIRNTFPDSRYNGKD